MDLRCELVPAFLVSDVNEVIQKVVSQDQQQANLKQLTKENQAQIELLNKEIAVLKDRVDSVKYSGPSAKTVSGTWWCL